MAMEYKTSHRAYAAWNYRQEIEDLNRASEQGWQLVRGGCFFSRFVKNPDVRYRYQMDWRKVEDMGRYIETFREQGWEYVSSTFNGWHFFRKFYDPALKEEDYEIFTDRESLQAMTRRWSRVVMAISAALLAVALIIFIQEIRTPNIPRLFETLILLTACAFLMRGGFLMRSPDTIRRGDNTLLHAFLLFLVVGWTGTMALLILRPDFSIHQYTAELSEPYEDNRFAEFEVYYPDSYYLDLKIDADAPFAFSIVNEAGEAVYSVTGTDIDEENVRIRLKRGKYWFSSSCGAGFELEAYLN